MDVAIEAVGEESEDTVRRRGELMGEGSCRVGSDHFIYEVRVYVKQLTGTA